MKKKIIGIFICMLLIATAIPALGTMNKIEEREMPSFYQSEVEWEKTYGGDEFDWLYDIQPTSDGGYIAAGLSEEDNMNYAWILKVNVTGEEEWSDINYDINGTVIEDEVLIECVRETKDGYIVAGFARWYDEYNGWWATVGGLWKVNLTGETEWVIPVGVAEEQWTIFPMNIIVENDGFVFGGMYFGPEAPEGDIALAKTDLDGNLLWHYHYDGGGTEFARSFWKTDDGGYFLSGTTWDNDQVDLEAFYMLKVLNNGTKDWDAMFDGPNNDWSPTMGCRQTSDGGYIMSGTTYSYGNGLSDAWIIKTDENGNEQWNKTFGGPLNDRNYGMDQIANDSYVFVIIKNAYSISGTRDDTWIININNEGNLEWEYLIEKEEIQWSQSIVQTDDEGFIVAGRTGPMDSKISDGLIFKVAPFPHLDFKIKGGLGIKLKITNNGKGDAISVPCKIKLEGGLIGMINKTVARTIDIEAGAAETISTGVIIGFGPFKIKITAGVKEETHKGFNLLAFSLVF